MLSSIGHTRLTPYAASQCMGSLSVTFLDRKLMLQDLCANYLMTWNQEYQHSSVGLVFPLRLQCNKRNKNFFPPNFSFCFQFIDEACHQIERNERNMRPTAILGYIPRYLHLMNQLMICLDSTAVALELREVYVYKCAGACMIVYQ